MRQITNRWVSPTLRTSKIFNRGVTRRFGTAKRLGEMSDTRKCYFSWDIFDNLWLLWWMKYNLSFGSAKPTKSFSHDENRERFWMQQLILNRDNLQNPHKGTPNATAPQ